jgi:hypothetical protein
MVGSRSMRGTGVRSRFCRFQNGTCAAATGALVAAAVNPAV